MQKITCALLHTPIKPTRAQRLEFRENGNARQQPGDPVRGSSTIAGTPSRQSCDTNTRSRGHPPALGTRSPSIQGPPAGTATVQLGVEERGMLMRGEPAPNLLFPARHFFQGFALHLLCADPHEDREGGMPATGQLLCQTPDPRSQNISPGPHNVFPLNLTLGNI